MRVTQSPSAPILKMSSVIFCFLKDTHSSLHFRHQNIIMSIRWKISCVVKANSFSSWTWKDHCALCPLYIICAQNGFHYIIFYALFLLLAKALEVYASSPQRILRSSEINQLSTAIPNICHMHWLGSVLQYCIKGTRTPIMIYYQPSRTYYYEMSLLVLNLAVMCFSFRGACMGDKSLH